MRPRSPPPSPGVTSKIGFVSTATTTFNLPYGLARQFQTIDQLSGGRLGWNAVTSFGGERQFGLDELPDQTTRYQRAAEFVDIVQGLWRGWHADAVSPGPGNRPRIDAGKIDQLSYEGEFLRAHGALGLPRSPQDGRCNGRPVPRPRDCDSRPGRPRRSTPPLPISTTPSPSGRLARPWPGSAAPGRWSRWSSLGCTWPVPSARPRRRTRSRRSSISSTSRRPAQPGPRLRGRGGHRT